jgi:hypothetical protein
VSTPTVEDRHHLKVSEPQSPPTDPRGEPPALIGFH